MQPCVQQLGPVRPRLKPRIPNLLQRRRQNAARIGRHFDHIAALQHFSGCLAVDVHAKLVPAIAQHSRRLACVRRCSRDTSPSGGDQTLASRGDGDFISLSGYDAPLAWPRTTVILSIQFSEF